MENLPDDSPKDSDVSYAEVVSRMKVSIDDVSNMNTADKSDTTNGNESLSAVEDLVNRNTPMKETDFNDYSNIDNQKSQLPSKNVGEDSKSNRNSEKSSESSSTSLNDLKSSTLVAMNEEASLDLSESESHEMYNSSSDDNFPNAVKWVIRPEGPLDLPDTVTVLESRYGSKVYLVGTAHFSVQSQEDVRKTIRSVQPDVVLLELCNSRLNILSLDEQTVLEEAENMSFQKIKVTIEQNGVMQGILYFLLLSMSYHLTKQLGMAPGGEFRSAYKEVLEVPGCIIRLGDRPIHITLHRALAKLSLWQKLRVAWHILRSKGPITKEEVERCKQKDLLEEMLAEMAGEFPELSQVFVAERDLFLTYSLQMAALPMPMNLTSVPAPPCVVGVVGIGHVRGIVENWEKVKDEDIPPILEIPEPSRTRKVLFQVFRWSLIGFGVYGAYKIVPKSLIPHRPMGMFPSFSLKQW